jgi:hypothetical protein
MVNICELLINVVNRDKPKMLTGLSQNGKGSGMDAPNSSITDEEPPAKRQDLTRAGTCTERGKPVGLPGFEQGKRAARDADGPAGMGWWKKRRLPCNGEDRD